MAAKLLSLPAPTTHARPSAERPAFIRREAGSSYIRTHKPRGVYTSRIGTCVSILS